MKNSPARLRLDPDVEEEVKRISEKTGLSQVEVIRQIVKAGALAIKENNYVLPTPLRVRVETDLKKEPGKKLVGKKTLYPAHAPQGNPFNETHTKR